MKFNHVLLAVAIGLVVGFLLGHCLIPYTLAVTSGGAFKMNNITGTTWTLSNGRWAEIPN